jgi:antitoxin component of RelBE/YafQ-DinJ toxin-antitoxin module
MLKNLKKSDVVQTSITMERELKERYSKLALKMDLSFSQLVRLGLKKVEEDTR